MILSVIWRSLWNLSLIFWKMWRILSTIYWYTFQSMWLIIMAALGNMANHYIFALWLLLSSFFLFLCSLSIIGRRKIRHLGTITQNLSGYIFTTKAHIVNRKKAAKQQYLLQMHLQYGQLRPTSGWERSGSWVVWGTPANFNGFRVLAALLHGTPVVGVSQTLALHKRRPSTRQAGHHVGHWATF